jgi:ubiquinone biosynthesis protein
MVDLIQSLVVVYLFAWVSRALLGARELTWRRTLFAAVAGIIFGQALGAVIIADDLESLTEIDPAQLMALALPLSLIGTMGAIVVLELLFISKPSAPGVRLIRPWRAMGRWAGMWKRGFSVLRIVTRHGLAPLLGLRRGDVSTRKPSEVSRRIRLSLEEAGGMFVKLGQLMVTRPDLLPPEAVTELSRLQADVAPLAEPEVREIVTQETGRPLEEVFSSIDWAPIGSASIGQAHTAVLRDGSEVVVKVRRPGLEVQVDRDLAITKWLASLAERRTSWGQAYRVTELTEEFSDVLRSELRFDIEGQNAADMTTALEDHPGIRVPGIIDPLTTERMLVMERLTGIPLSKTTGRPDNATSRALADDLCVSQVRAMLAGERFHGDPHPGNVLLLEDGGLGLVDFGITGRLDTFERASVFQMLIALKLDQPTVLYEALMSVGAVTPGHDPDEVERALARFLAAHIGSGLPSPEALTELLRLVTRLGMRMPASTTTMFRALATLAGTLETLSPGYPILDVIADLGGVELRERMTPGSLTELVQQEWAQLQPLLRRAPRHLDRIATLLEHGRLTTRVTLFTDPDEVRTVERLLNRAVLSFLSIGLGVVSVLLLGAEGGPVLVATDVTFFEVLGWMGLTTAVILLLRVLLAVLRTEQLPSR